MWVAVHNDHNSICKVATRARFANLEVAIMLMFISIVSVLAFIQSAYLKMKRPHCLGVEETEIALISVFSSSIKATIIHSIGCTEESIKSSSKL